MAVIAERSPAPPASAVTNGEMRVRVYEITEIFNAIDPSPLVDRDLNEETERFIVSWARDFPPDAPLRLTIEVSGPPSASDPTPPLEEAVHVFFARRAETTERELRALLRRGRTSLVIGLVFLTVCVIAADLVGNALRGGGGELGVVMREGLNVAGWVAMWRPMEIFLYAWWPLASDRKLYTRLARMPVQVKWVGPASA